MNHLVLNDSSSDKIESCCVSLKSTFIMKFFSSKDVQTYLNGLVCSDLHGKHLKVCTV